MTSLLCIQEPGGFVEHNHKDYADIILKDSSNHAVFSKYFPDDKVRPRFHSKRPFSTPNPHIVHDNLDKQELIGHSMKLQAWLNNKSVSLVQEKSDLEARPVKQMYGAVLQKEETLVKDLQEYVDNHQYLGERKKEILHKNWNERVYEPIRKAVIKEMGSANYTNYKCRKDQLYREYIEHVNKKGHVFRDDYDPSEYYAMGLHANRPMVVSHQIERQGYMHCYHTKSTPLPPIIPSMGMQATLDKPLQDPTLLQGSMRDAEDETIIRCTSGSKYRGKSLDTIRLPTLPLVPQGRHGTENETWIAMPLTDIESPVRQTSRGKNGDVTLKGGRAKPPTFDIDNIKMRRMVGSNLRSEINFGDWSVNQYGSEVRDAEMGIQKRRQCPQPPFTTPRVIGYARKKLPAAKESRKSRTLPFGNPKYNNDGDCPYGLSEPEPTISTAAQMGLDSKWRLHTAPAASQSTVKFNEKLTIIPETSTPKHESTEQAEPSLVVN